MYGKGKIIGIPSDSQSKEKLAMYVYEYLIHVGAQKTANSFLQEIRWDKSVSVGEPPGFLHSWWSVFWDLYSAAPERRDTHEHTSEAKAFHDYGFVNSGYPNGLPHEHCMPPRGLSSASFLHRAPQSCHLGLSPEAGSLRQRHCLPTSMLPVGAHPGLRFHPAAGQFTSMPAAFMQAAQPMHHGPSPRPRWMQPQATPGHPAVTSATPLPPNPGTPLQLAALSPNGDLAHASLHQHHLTPPQYAGQQLSPPASTLGPELIYSGRSVGQLIMGPQTPVEAPFCGALMEGVLNGSGMAPRNSMMPPPPPDYMAGLPTAASTPGDLKMSPMHTGHPNDLLGQAGQMVLPTGDYVSGGAFGLGQLGPESIFLQPSTGMPAGCNSAGMLHAASASSQQQGPPPQYITSHHQASASSAPHLGPVHFPQEYSFNPISQ